MDKTLQFKGLWAVILGGSGGFGLAAAEKLASQGMNIAVIYREMAAADKLARERFSAIASTNNVEVLAYNINALNEAGRENFLQQVTASVGKTQCVKVLLHAIARGNLKPLTADTPEAEAYGTLTAEDIQLTTYAMSNSLLDWANLLIKAESVSCKGARIIGLTSEGAHKYWDGYAAVSIAKASLESLAKYMAVEFGTYGIKNQCDTSGHNRNIIIKKNTRAAKN